MKVVVIGNKDQENVDGLLLPCEGKPCAGLLQRRGASMMQKKDLNAFTLTALSACMLRRSGQLFQLAVRGRRM